MYGVRKRKMGGTHSLQSLLSLRKPALHLYILYSPLYIYYFFLLYCDRTVMYTCNLCRRVPFFLSFFFFSILFMESSRCMLNPRVTAVYLWSTSLLKLFICTECCTRWNICCLLSQPKCLYLWFECRNTHSPSQKDLFNPCPDIISTDRV